jgi:heptosyltransferase-2
MNNILIETPTWLGDSVMTTPAIENIVRLYPKIKITIFGSSAASAIFKQHPNVVRIIVDDSRAKKSRFLYLYQTAKTLKFDAAFSFRRRLSSKFFVFFVNSKYRYHYQRYTQKICHQVVRYNDFINASLGVNTSAGQLKIYGYHKENGKKTLALNPGASYGSAKRWYPQGFANVAAKLANTYDIIILGGTGEIDIAQDIAQILDGLNIENYQNLANKTSLPDLIKQIAQLDLFITGDSGPMHIAAAFQIATVSIFGPTKDKETAQWSNQNSQIVKNNLDCQPCMKRACPLTGKAHHLCMKQINVQAVLKAVQLLGLEI